MVFLCLVSSLLYAGAFPAVEIPYLAWFALIPLLYAAQGLTPLQAFRTGWFAGFLTYALLVYWVMIVMGQYGNLPWYATIPLWFALSAWLGLFHGLALSFLPRAIRHNIPIWLVMPAAWVAADFLRATFLTGFPWTMLGHSQYRMISLIQMADLMGVYGITALVVLVNSSLYLFIVHRQKSLQTTLVPTPIIISAICLAASVGYGHVRLNEPLHGGPPMTVALIQANIDQSVKWSPEYRDTTMDIFSRLSRTAAPSRPDLVVWPESAAPFNFQERGSSSEQIQNLTRELGSYLLFGSPATEQRQGRTHYLNSAFLLRPDGSQIGRADKLHLVPFGEYVPLASMLPFVKKMVAGIGDFSPGTTARTLPMANTAVGVLVCYEAVFPEIARRYTEAGSKVLVNVTNDAWFGRSSAPHQHLAMTVFRGIENRTPLVRAANTGISAIINQHGVIVAHSDLFREAVVTQSITPGTGTSFYQQFGDIFAWLCLSLCGWILILQWRQKKGTNNAKHR